MGPHKQLRHVFLDVTGLDCVDESFHPGRGIPRPCPKISSAVAVVVYDPAGLAGEFVP
jgi:hypothetical protein